MGEITIDSIIKEKGLKYSYVSECLGVSSNTLRRKRNGQSQWKRDEIATLCDLLEIKSATVKKTLFF